MRSKKSKNEIKTLLKKDEITFSEADLPELGREISSLLSPGVCAVFEGPMGVGKSTLIRQVIESMGVNQEVLGSPTFSIANEYTSSGGQRIIHADLYRLKSESEIEDSGVLEAAWDPNGIFLVEWASKFPVFFKALITKPNIEILIDFVPKAKNSDVRRVLINRKNLSRS